MKHYYSTSNRLPYQKRLRNRCIAIALFAIIAGAIATCAFSGGNTPNEAGTTAEQTTQESAVGQATKQNVKAETKGNSETQDAQKIILVEQQNSSTQDQDEKALDQQKLDEMKAADSLEKAEDQRDGLSNTQATIMAAVAPENAPVPEVIDSAHIKAQKNVFLAEKIDQMLRRYRPDYGIVLVVDAKSNEIIAWGERRDEKVQNQPDYFVKNSFPAASLAKTVTIAAALESGRYDLSSAIPMRGASHTLYKSQLRIPENYTGSTIEMQDAFAKSSNAPLAIIGMNVGAKKLRSTARNLGYNMNFPGGIPAKANYAPPDTGYGLAETSCGFTEATTLPPLLAAAQVRAIITKQPLEIPWAENLAPYAPSKRIALDVDKLSPRTYNDLREAMIRAVTHGTARKHMSRKNMARKNYEALNLGGKTGSLDGKDPAGRYEWYMGFAQSKENPDKAIVVVVMQVHKEIRSQPATQVAAVIINHWAHQNLYK